MEKYVCTSHVGAAGSAGATNWFSVDEGLFLSASGVFALSYVGGRPTRAR